MLASRVSVGPTSNAGSNVLCGASEIRYSITFFAPNGGLATITNNLSPTQGSGILLMQNSPPVTLTVDTHGDCVQQEWYVNYATSGFPITFIEALATCDPDQRMRFGRTLKERNQIWDKMLAG